MLNMSLSGIAAESTVAMPVGETSALRIRGGDKVIEVKARVKWSRLEGSRSNPGAYLGIENVYNVGFDYSEAAAKKAEDLRGFIAENAVVELDHRVLGHFGLSTSQESTSQESKAQGFEALRISASEILARTQLTAAPPIGTTVEIDLDDERLRIHARARVLSIDPADAESVQVRLEIQEMPPADVQKLEAFLRTLV